jgi:hypothetical protein
MWAAKSFPRCTWKKRNFSPSDAPGGTADGVNLREHSEQAHPLNELLWSITSLRETVVVMPSSLLPPWFVLFFNSHRFSFTGLLHLCCHAFRHTLMMSSSPK